MLLNLHFSVHSDLIVTVFGQVLYPGAGFVSASVDDFEVSDLEAGDCEEGDLEFYVEWHFFVVVSLWGLDGGEFELGVEDVLLVAGELFDCPF